MCLDWGCQGYIIDLIIFYIKLIKLIENLFKVVQFYPQT